ncbi:DDHD domain-containing protein [Kalaharituber pfeilii]|nr:DDHD domain-containing protein [Kalaharituber pfeilii]
MAPQTHGIASHPSRAPRSAPNSVQSSRAPTPKPYNFDKPANDHTVPLRPRLSQKEYPPDCPPLNVRWFYAVDVPKSTTFPTIDQASKPPKPASKYVPFSSRDSHAIESTFSRLAEAEEAAEQASKKVVINSEDLEGDLGERPQSRQQRREKVKDVISDEEAKVPVNEDYLFDVNIKTREISPVYWLGPSYDVRRGTWFYQDGSTLRPCEENLATQLEDGYLVCKPFRQALSEKQTPGSVSGTAPENLAPPTTEATSNTKSSSASNTTWRLFGSYMNSFVVYADPHSAWLMTDDFYGKLSSTLYQRVTSGQHMGGTKLVRGYSEGTKSSDNKKLDVSQSASRPVTPTPETKALKVEVNNAYKRKSMPPPSTTSDLSKSETSSSDRLDPRRTLERQLSGFDSELVGENKMLEEEMKEDYKNPDENPEDQGREIEYLLLTTHGIGQRLSERLASVNFVHDVNVFRKTLKNVYGYSPDLQAINDELNEPRKNCRIQCLPVCWRHLVDFPERSLRHNRNVREHDLGSGSPGQGIEEEEYPTLADITVEGVPSVRSLITDLALDILLYQSPTYKEHIARTVLDECNRIYALFKKRNPGFRGKVSLVGHSLGSAILFDLLCRQPDMFDGNRMGFKPSTGGSPLVFDFPVENLFCLGSPIGLFQMLKGRAIAARSYLLDNQNIQSPIDPESDLASEADSLRKNKGTARSSSFQVSSPACRQIYNIFHPTDPIAYRIEPLVSRAMADLKPQPLPYTKRGIWAGTTQLAGGITGLGQTVTKSVSGLWSSLSSGIASSILNRSLGFTDAKGEVGERAFEKMREQRNANAKGANSKLSNPPTTAGSEEDDTRQSVPTLLDGEIETLYEGFQRRRDDLNPGELDEDGMDEKAGRLKLEEAKVRALNATGRIDFAIQEGVFDLSLISSLASHLGYWSDEDVSHFIISQLLARRGFRKSNSNPTISMTGPTPAVPGGTSRSASGGSGIFGSAAGRRGSASSGSNVVAGGKR